MSEWDQELIDCDGETEQEYRLRVNKPDYDKDCPEYDKEPK